MKNQREESPKKFSLLGKDLEPNKNLRPGKRKVNALTSSNVRELAHGKIKLKKQKAKVSNFVPKLPQVNLMEEANSLKNLNKSQENASKIDDLNKSHDKAKKEDLLTKVNVLDDQTKKEKDDSSNKLINLDDQAKICLEGNSPFKNHELDVLNKSDESNKLDEASQLVLKTHSPLKDFETIKIDFLNLPEKVKDVLERFVSNLKRVEASNKDLNERVTQLEQFFGESSVSENNSIPNGSNLMKGDKLVPLYKGSTKFVSQVQLNKAKKLGVAKKFVTKIFSSVVSIGDVYRKTYSGRSKHGSKKEFSRDIVDEFIQAVNYHIGKNKDSEDVIKNVIIAKLSAFNLFFNKLKAGEKYSKELIQKCKLSEDDTVYLKDLKKYTKDISLFDELDKIEEDYKTELKIKDDKDESKSKNDKNEEIVITNSEDKDKKKVKKTKKAQIEDSDDDSDDLSESSESSTFESDSEAEKNFDSDVSEKLKKYIRKEKKEKKKMKMKMKSKLDQMLSIKELKRQLKDAKKSLNFDD